MNIDFHSGLRETYKWGTYGKNGDEPLRWVILKDIHDDHLQNIINMMREHQGAYSLNNLNIMLSEQEYRQLKKIRIPFKFGH